MVCAMSLARLALVVGASLSIAGCGGAAKDASNQVKTTAQWDAAGPLGVGVHTFTFVDTSRKTMANGSYAGADSRTLVTAVWYPSTMPFGPTTDAPPRPGKYPLVIHSHGFLDGETGETYLAAHLASYGYVVAAPRYPLSNGAAPGGATVLDTPNQPGDATFVLDQILQPSSDVAALFGDAITIDSNQIVASGLSLGGLTTLLLAFHPTYRDARIKAAFTMAPPSCMFTADYFMNAPAMPLVLLQGDADAIVLPPANTERSYPMTKAPSTLVLMKGGSHTAFAGIAAKLGSSSYDVLGCMELGNIDVTDFSELGTAAEGITQDPMACPAPCQDVPTAPSLDAQRQQDLTTALEQAFFDFTLGRNSTGDAFLTTGAAAENAELTVSAHRAAP